MTFPFVIVLMLCIGNVYDVLSSPIGLISPFAQVVYNSTRSVGAAITLSAISTAVAFAAGLDLYGATARMIWSLSRDEGLPRIFSVVHPKLDVPVFALLAVLVPTILIPMIYIWNSTAFYGIMAGVLVFFQLSYFIPIFLNIIFVRCRRIRPRSPWSLGKLGLAVDIFSACWTVFITIFMSFPVYQPVTAVNM